jgi:hypothetical protein
LEMGKELEVSFALVLRSARSHRTTGKLKIKRRCNSAQCSPC